MSYTDIRHHHARFPKVPKGFTRYRRKSAPVKGEVYIELVHRTAEGYAVGPRRKAKLVRKDEWRLPATELGSIAGWRLAPAE